MPERWLPIPGYVGLYEVSDQGRVRRSGGGRGASKGRVLTAKRATNGYQHVDLSRGDVKTRFGIHRLVALAFLGPAPENAVVNHLDGNKVSNVAQNLEWCSAGENNRHAYRTGLRRPPNVRGARNPRARLSPAEANEIRALSGMERQRETAARFGVARSTVQAIQSGRNWRPAEWPEDLRVREFPR